MRHLRRRQGDRVGRRAGRGRAARRPTAPALEHGLDVFHTAYEAKRVLAQHWRAPRPLGSGRTPRRPRSPTRNSKGSMRGVARAARARGTRRARCSSGPNVSKRPGTAVTPRWACLVPTVNSTTAPGHGRNRRGAGGPAGPDWSKVRNFLNDARSLTFLDRMHRRLESAEPRPECASDGLAVVAATPPAHAVAPADRAGAGRRADRPLTGEEEASYARVAAVLKSTVRAAARSSA